MAKPEPPPKPQPRSMYVFHGYGGHGRAVGSPENFPDTPEFDASFRISGETLRDTLQKRFPDDKVFVQKAWEKNSLLATLASAADPIAQVHIMCHGAPTRASLAAFYDNLSRLRARARRFNALPKPDDEANVVAALREEDALCANFFKRGMDAGAKAALKGRHARDASWHIWACACGNPEGALGYPDPEIDVYLKRFGFGQLKAEGIAIEIARELGVVCTASIEDVATDNGLAFWHGDAKKNVVRNDNKTGAKKPFWMWIDPKAKWVSYDAAGKAMPEVSFMGVTRKPADLPKDGPPKWLTDAYWA